MFWRRSEDWMALLVSLQLVTQGTTSLADVLERSQAPWQLPASLLDLLNASLLFLVFSLFPSGRFVPRWIRWVALVFVGYQAAPFVPALSFLAPFAGPIWFAFLLSLVAAQVYRYRRVSSPVQRQQTKWVVTAFATIILVQFGLFLPTVFFPSFFQSRSLYSLFALGTLSPVILLIGPLSITVAILRYRLWDIDLIINKGLVYGALTVSLACVYLGIVVSLQHVLQAFTGGSSQLAIVASTLTIAALFSPLRRRIQAFIDRRFYRRKYDAARTLEAFGAKLRNETNIEDLSGELVSVVRDTIQPEHVSLWLRETAEREQR